MIAAEPPEVHDMPLNAFEKGRLKIIAHVREELVLAGIAHQSIFCKYGGTLTPPGTVRLQIVTAEGSGHVDLKDGEVEECETLVAGEIWYKIAGLIDRFR